MNIQKGGIARCGGTASPEELKAINAFAKTELTAEEVYTFSVLLCDNEVDRDFERFTEGTLKELQSLFVGKTGISDHEWSSGRQVARIYRTELVTEQGKKTAAGTPYMYLRGYAYMLRTEETAGLIADIEGGIKRETSVGCAVAETRCSICGETLGGGKCSHRKGESYGGKLCCGELTGAVDAYEWSFVAVPAQKNAGVIKAFGKYGSLKQFAESEEGRSFAGEYAALEKAAEAGRYYVNQLKGEVLRLALLCDEKLYAGLFGSCGSMDHGQLESLKAAFEAQLAQRFPMPTQLGGRNETVDFRGDEYLV